MPNTHACRGDLDGANKGKPCSWRASPEGSYCGYCGRWDSQDSQDDDNGWMSDFGTDEFHEFRDRRRYENIITVQRLKWYKTKSKSKAKSHAAAVSLTLPTSNRKSSEDSVVSGTSSMSSSTVLATPTSPTISEPEPFPLPLPQVKNADVKKIKSAETESWRHNVAHYTLV